MAYTKNRKKNGIGREYRGRKSKDHDPRIQKLVDETVDDIGEKMYEEHKRRIYNSHAIALPDVRFDHPGLYNGKGGYTPADKIAAVTAFMVTGSVRLASKYCGVPHQTLSTWRKTEWWATLTQQVKKEKNDVLDAEMTAVIHSAVGAALDRIVEGDSHYDSKRGEIYKMPVKGKDLAAMTAMLFDKRQLLRGDVTSRSERVSTDQRLNKLKKQFEAFSTARDISDEAEVIEDD